MGTLKQLKKNLIKTTKYERVKYRSYIIKEVGYGIVFYLYIYFNI